MNFYDGKNIIGQTHLAGRGETEEPHKVRGKVSDLSGALLYHLSSRSGVSQSHVTGEFQTLCQARAKLDLWN